MQKEALDMYEWIVGGLAALDLGIKKEIERQ